MASNSPGRPAETREMRMVSQLIAQSEKVGDVSLAAFLAERRQPDRGPMSWEQISHDLKDVIGELVSSASLRKWAATYQIPESRTFGAKMSQHKYVSGLHKVGVDLTQANPQG